MHTRRLIQFVFLTPLLALLAAGFAVAQENGGKDERKGRKPASEVKVWTNEELAKLASGDSDPEPTTLPPVPAPSPATPVTPTPAAAAADPLAAIQQAAQRRVDKQAEIAAAEAAVGAARARVTTLEKQALAVRNPYLPRPKVDESQREAWKGMNAAERAALTAKELEEARAAVERAQAALDAARRAP